MSLQDKVMNKLILPIILVVLAIGYLLINFSTLTQLPQYTAMVPMPVERASSPTCCSATTYSTTTGATIYSTAR